MYNIYIPKSEILRKYISEFTVLKKGNDKPLNYIAFPHCVSSIAFYSNASIKYDTSKIIIDETDRNVQSIIVLGKYLKPVLLSYKSIVDEIAVNFTSTGINYFFDNNYDKLSDGPFQFMSNEKWNNFSHKLFVINEKKRIELLENFLVSQLRYKDLKNVEFVIDSMKNDLSIKVKDIALKMKLSDRTINRLFHKYIGCSPIAYKKILRFRSSVLMNDNEMSLTELCLNNEYYDSPHFTNEFKKLTSKNPKSFFKSLIKVGDGNFPYVFK